MRPINFTERKKNILVFAAMFTASMVLVAFILSAFNTDIAPKETRIVENSTATTVMANNDILKCDSTLHSQLKQLEQLDIQFAHTLEDPAKKTGKLAAAQIIAGAEEAFKKSIDSIEQVVSAYNNPAADSLYSGILTSFKSVLNSRSVMANMRMALTDGKAGNSDVQENLVKWRNELLEKDNKIASLESEIKKTAYKHAEPLITPVPLADNFLKKENEDLKITLKTQQNNYTDLLNKNNRLKTDFGNLTTQLNDLKRLTVASDASNTGNKSKTIELEQQVDELNAALNFARIDCNLSRVDAQQIISNARQRKDLLSESLLMLNTLSKSDDEAVQKKAREKLVRLNHIAGTLRD